MSRYTNQPTFDGDFVKPQRFRLQVLGGSIDGGRNGLGEGISIDMTGGGILSCTYGDCFVQAPEQHEYINWIAARCDGSVRFVNVAILSDWSGPFPRVNGIPMPIIRGIPHSDGALFSDGSGYSQATVYGKTTADAVAGKISMRVYGAARRLRHSDWFSIYHATKGWRAYRYWDVLSETDGVDIIAGVETSYREYQLAITPPLREMTPSGTRVEFARPRCVMKFPVGFTLAWEIEGFYQSRPTIQFVEAF